MELVIIVWPVTIGYHCMVTISIGRFALNIYITVSCWFLQMLYLVVLKML